MNSNAHRSTVPHVPATSCRVRILTGYTSCTTLMAGVRRTPRADVPQDSLPSPPPAGQWPLQMSALCGRHTTWGSVPSGMPCCHDLSPRLGPECFHCMDPNPQVQHSQSCTWNKTVTQVAPTLWWTWGAWMGVQWYQVDLHWRLHGSDDQPQSQHGLSTNRYRCLPRCLQQLCGTTNFAAAGHATPYQLPAYLLLPGLGPGFNLVGRGHRSWHTPPNNKTYCNNCTVPQSKQHRYPQTRPDRDLST
jgi:hypothetical protein